MTLAISFISISSTAIALRARAKSSTGVRSKEKSEILSKLKSRASFFNVRVQKASDKTI